MQISVFQVDAFTDKVFGGNSASVCLLESWLPAELMQQIAMENAVAETAFIKPINNDFEIRWFTPEIEMDLCGHATLAAAHVIQKHLYYQTFPIRFLSNSGELLVTHENELLTLNFPSRMPQQAKAPQIILDGIGGNPEEILKSRDYILVFANEDIIRDLRPNQSLLNQINIDPGGVIVTAPGKEVDFVSRFFTPQASIFEDPVTGSAHCSLIPYWSKRLNKDEMIALQLSARGGKLFCKNRLERVLISGKALTYLVGTISI